MLKYEYYTDKKNTVGNEYFGRHYRGADNVNPVKRMTHVMIGKAFIEHTDYNYQYDSVGRIVSQSTYINGLYIETATYTYY